MFAFSVTVATRSGLTTAATFESLAPCVKAAQGFTVRIGDGFPHPVVVTPPSGHTIASITYAITTPLENFHQVIVPDTGRQYSNETQLVGFWGRTFPSRINAIRMPVYVLTGQDLKTRYAFGVIGENFETDYVVREPAMRRALLAYMKRFTLEIRRGVEGFPIPDSVACARQDRSIAEHIYFREWKPAGGGNWLLTLRDFSQHMARLLGKAPHTTRESMEPYWCSWTDWNSADVTDTVILDNVRAGVPLGITNYIIDDGWFGPGLDSDFGVRLNIGDWAEDPKKIPDLRKLVADMHALGACAIIWCAPHAVSPDAKCFPDRRHLLIHNKPGVPVLTSNGYHPLCFMCPEARELMADICAGFIHRYDVDGGKYDLFNNIPGEACVSAEHRHDTTSMIEGLSRTMELIHRKTTAIKPDFITELKQNYGTPWLYEYGTVVRAGDTPYNPEGNFLRTAYINAYTPYSMNDYQTITSTDSPQDGRLIMIKMIAAGIPTYSMDLCRLSADHARSLAFYHRWYMDRIVDFMQFRTPVDDRLCCWKVGGRGRRAFFLVNGERCVSLDQAGDCDIVNGISLDTILLSLPASAPISLSHRGPDYPPTPWIQLPAAKWVEAACPSGSILSIRVSGATTPP